MKDFEDMLKQHLDELRACITVMKSTTANIGNCANRRLQVVNGKCNTDTAIKQKSSLKCILAITIFYERGEYNDTNTGTNHRKPKAQ